MKVQIDVDQELWRRIRIAAIEKGDKLGVFVGKALSSAVGGLRAGGTDGDAQRGGSIPRSKTVKAVSITASESKNPAPSPQPKEGYGWCMGCKTSQVKLPGLLCAKCVKEQP